MTLSAVRCWTHAQWNLVQPQLLIGCNFTYFTRHYLIFICGLLTKLSVTQNTYHHQMIGWLVNNELERIWKNAVVVYFKVLSQHLPGGTEYNHKVPASIAGLRTNIIIVIIRSHSSIIYYFFSLSSSYPVRTCYMSHLKTEILTSPCCVVLAYKQYLTASVSELWSVCTSFKERISSGASVAPTS
jgi:hypothetical protein